MRKLNFLLLLFVAVTSNAQPDTTLAIGKCATCDTLYKKDRLMPDGSPMIRKVTCYYADDYGTRTDEVYSIVRFRNGLKHGSEEGFYRKQEWLYVNWLKRPVEKPSGFMLYMTDIGLGYLVYYNRYSGYWKKGEKNLSWAYYDTLQRVVYDTLFFQGKPSMYEGWMIMNFDLTINGNGQTRKSDDGDTLWLWNVANNQLEGDLFEFDKHHRIKEHYLFQEGRLLSKKIFRKGTLRKEEFYDMNGTIVEFFRYDKTSEPIKHKLLGPSYSYKSPTRYINAGIP